MLKERTFAMLVGGVCGIAMSVPQIAEAQQAPATTDKSVDAGEGAIATAVTPVAAAGGDIVVTARKREETLAKVPIAIDVATGQEIFTKRLNDLQALSGSSPNVQFASDSGFRARVSVRGIGADTSGLQGPGVGFFIDGVYQVSTASLNQPFFDLERVEVLKGPQGTLYGRNALAGVINFVTPKPGDQVVVSAIGEAANFDSYRAGLAVGGPLVKDLLFARISVQHAASDGPFVYNATDDRVAPTLFNAVRGRLVFTPVADLELDLTGNVNRLKSGAFPYANVIDLPQLRKNFVLNPPNSADVRSKDANLLVTKSFGGTKLTSRTFYSRQDTASRYDGDLGPTTALFGVSKSQIKSWSEEVRLQGDIAVVSWMIGGAYFQERRSLPLNELFGSFIDTAIGIPGVRVNQQNFVRSKVWSGFTDNTVSLGRLELGFGLRYDKVDSTNTAPNSLIVGGTAILLGTPVVPLNEDAWQPKVTARYEVDPELNVYATVAKGYRQGGFNIQSAGTSDASFRGDLLWNYEAGLKYRRAGGGLSANASTFYIDQERVTGNSFVQTLSGAPGSGVRPFGSARSYGLEADISARLSDAVRVSLAGGWTDCRYNRVASVAFKGIEKGGQCVDSSAWNGRADLNYSAPLHPGSDLTLIGNAYVQGRGNTRVGIDVNDDDFRQVQRTYVLAGASIGLRKGGWQLFGFVDNIFDRLYATTIFTRERIALFGGTQDAVILGTPRTYGLRLRIDY